MWSLEQEEANSETGYYQPVLFFKAGALESALFKRHRI
jgi:hypothetical protein